jgi:hypothetical protein
LYPKQILDFETGARPHLKNKIKRSANFFKNLPMPAAESFFYFVTALMSG